MKEETRGLLGKAERSLRAAETLMRDDDAEFACGRVYYAMLHTAQALLRERGVQYRRHSGVHSAFGQHFAKTGRLDPKFHRWLLDAFDRRLLADYDVETTVDAATVETMIEQARELLRTATSFPDREP